MKIAHIAPFNILEDVVKMNKINMILVHLCNNEKYVETYRNTENYKILDNSFYELSRSAGKYEMFEAAKQVKANCVVLEDGSLDHIDFWVEKGYEIMAVPTSLKEYFEFYTDPRVSKIGISSLHLSKILSSDRNLHKTRFHFLEAFKETLENKGIEYKKEKIHLLGAVNCPAEEINLCKYLANSIDTSAATWYAYNNLDIIEARKKPSKKVDFEAVYNIEAKQLAFENIEKLEKAAI